MTWLDFIFASMEQLVVVKEFALGLSIRDDFERRLLGADVPLKGREGPLYTSQQQADLSF